jgi:hypothetical protein
VVPISPIGVGVRALRQATETWPSPGPESPAGQTTGAGRTQDGPRRADRDRVGWNGWPVARASVPRSRGVLAEFGVPRPELDPADAMLAAMLAGDRAAAARLADENPGSLEQVRTARPGLIVWAAVLGRAAAVELLAELGFDVNAKARTDGPGTTEWETALHHAAGVGNLALARRLIELGADPGLRDHRFSSTPLGWARYFGQPELIAFLEPLTSPEEPG